MWQRGIDVPLMMRLPLVNCGTARVRTGHFRRVGVAVHEPTQVVYECAILPFMPAGLIIPSVTVTP